jgi:predicted enzyme related to lactoylglutathione lyase
MGERSSYAHGTFSWVENATTDTDGAKSFYSRLLGWEYDDQPIGEGIYYSMAKLGGRHVGAISPQQEDERAMGVPPHWNSYITVDDVDAVSGRVEELGGTVHAPPFDVFDSGRMSAISDATGAVVYFWQANQHIGAGLVNAPGAFCWNELATRDPDGAQRFWSELLGWEFEKVDAAPFDYWTIRNGGNSNGGMHRIGDETPAEVPAHWLVYFAVESIDDSAATVGDAGGQTLMPKTAAGGSNAFAAFRDPAGATFGLFEGELDD